MWRLLRALPALAATIARLMRDPAVPRAAKLALAAAVVYLASPIDLLPDVVPLVGYVDDVMVGALVLDGVLSFVDRRLVLRYWPGSVRSLDALTRVARTLTAWVPPRVKARLFSPGR
jgi:uncharacterized membrane protein YkvA (DUF1232 family)